MKATVKVVGMVAGGREHIVYHASEGDPALLVPEPDNAHDPNAIAVYTAPRTTLRDSTFLPDEDRWEVGPEDRTLLLDRQAGYIPAAVAARLSLPADGIVAAISTVRFAPPEYDPHGRQRDPRVVGIDVTGDLTMRSSPR